jgi:hypothetical protein
MARCPTRPLLVISSLALIAGPSFSAWAGGGACSGPLSQEHSLAGVDFYTNSVIQPNQDNSTKAIYPFVTKSCVVSAHVTASPLPVKWFAPKIYGWLNTDTSPIPVDILEIDQPRQMAGCLEYGYQSLSIKASFFGDSEAQKKVDRENEVGCRQTAAESSGSGGKSKGILEKLIRIVQPITNYFPSTSKYPKETMLHLKGEAGIAVKADDTYLSYFSYTLTPFSKDSVENDKHQDVKPDPTAVTVSPSFSGAAETLSNAYKASGNPQFVKTGANETEIDFLVTGIKNPKLVYATYVFFDADHEAVASVEVPVFVSQEK